MRFRFIHAADLHLDSPMRGLSARQPHLAALFAGATRRAFEALIEETLAREAAFLIISGDIYDGDWRDYHTGIYFADQLAKLARAGIPVFLIQGNHDADNKITRKLSLPATAHLFGTRKAETFELAQYQVVLHGRSFADAAVSENMVRSYPPARGGWFNIGVLHTSLDGRAGHANYAPCSLADLAAMHYDYWALGHIHAGEIVSTNPHVVFPGNLQGRHVRETGAKGAMLVEVENGAVEALTPLVLDKARWGHARIDVSGALSVEDLVRRIEPVLAAEIEAAQGRPLALRMRLEGETPAHDLFLAEGEHLQAEIQAAAGRIDDRLYIERIEIETRPPRRQAASGEAGFADPETLLDGLENDADFGAALAAAMEEIAGKLPGDVRQRMPASTGADRNALIDQARFLALGRLRRGVEPTP